MNTEYELDLLDDEDLELKPETRDDSRNYFIANSMRRRASTANLDDLDLPNSARIRQLCEKSDNIKEEKKELHDRWKKMYFENWYHSMGSHFNILIHGLGSKRALLDDFRQEWLLDEHHLVLYGFFTQLSQRQIISELSRAYGSETGISDESRLFSLINSAEHELYILFHSIDVILSQGLTGCKIKSFLSRLLSECRGKIHIIASMDHVNAGLLWGTDESHIFRWFTFNCPTLQSYWLEKNYSAGYDSKTGFSLATSLNQHLTLSSIEHVYGSLTVNAQKIFEIILNYYSKQANDTAKVAEPTKKPTRGRKPAINDSSSGDDSDSGDEFSTRQNDEFATCSSSASLLFSDLYRECREEFLVNSELTLRAQLIEFKDHKLIRLHKNPDGSETVQLLITGSVVEKFLAQLVQ